jgi:hypothetical protein
MYYGEGAGTRRKLITATVEAKAQRDPQYAQAFRQELSRQDMAEHASKARHERRKNDTTERVRRNTRALLTGNTQSAETLVLLVMAGVAAHKMGLDKQAYEKAQEISRRTRAWIKAKRQKLRVVD